MYNKKVTVHRRGNQVWLELRGPWLTGHIEGPKTYSAGLDLDGAIDLAIRILEATKPPEAPKKKS